MEERKEGEEFRRFLASARAMGSENENRGYFSRT